MNPPRLYKTSAKKRADATARYRAKRVEILEKLAAYREKNRDKIRARIAASTVARLVLIAGRPKPEACELCGGPPRGKTPRGGIVFDHDHATGSFRGWICARCNKTLGHVGDDPILLLKMAAYLEAPPGSTQ